MSYTYQDAVSFLREVNIQTRRRPTARDEVIRALSWDEWGIVEKLVKQYKLPCFLVRDSHGFSLVVYSFRKELLVTISNGQFSFPAGRGFASQREIIKRISALTHNEQNIEILKSLHFPPQDPNPESYTY